jgi:hypothetical protein
VGCKGKILILRPPRRHWVILLIGTICAGTWDFDLTEFDEQTIEYVCLELFLYARLLSVPNAPKSDPELLNENKNGECGSTESEESQSDCATAGLVDEEKTEDGWTGCNSYMLIEEYPMREVLRTAGSPIFGKVATMLHPNNSVYFRDAISPRVPLTSVLYPQ